METKKTEGREEKFKTDNGVFHNQSNDLIKIEHQYGEVITDGEPAILRYFQN
jgi:hypothetical protein